MNFIQMKNIHKVLNLVINGLPSIQKITNPIIVKTNVLNLVINGLPSIQELKIKK